MALDSGSANYQYNKQTNRRVGVANKLSGYCTLPFSLASLQHIRTELRLFFFEGMPVVALLERDLQL